MPRTKPSRFRGRVPIALLTTAVLVLAGCMADDNGDDDLAAPSPGETATASPSPSPSPTGEESPSPTGSPSEPLPVMPTVEIPDLDTQCTIEPDLPQVDRITYAVPAAWQVEDRCDVLDPEREDLPEQTEAEAAIFVSASGVSFTEVTGDDPASRDRVLWRGARSGLQAVRTTSVSTGEALAPEGQPTTRWAFDLDAGTDENGGVFTLTTGTVDGDAYDQAQAVADAIAQTVVILPQAADTPDAGFAVVRVEGGGTPYSITYDGDCFALRPGAPSDEASDERCDLDPTDGPLVAGVLGDDVLVGYAPAVSIAVQSEEVPPPYGLSANIEGGTVFAFQVDEMPSELTAIGPGGEELVTASVGS